MKAIGWILVCLSVLIVGASLACGLIYALYSYNVNVSQYVQLADDASTATQKLVYLQKYEEAIHKHIARNDARFIFTRERWTRDKQLEILATLQTRLQEAAAMNPLSFEYQTAINQITGQEFDHALQDINKIIEDCWFRQSGLAIFCLWFQWILTIPMFVAGIIFLMKDYEF